MISWSGGKDAAWALHKAREEMGCVVSGLFCTYDPKTEKIPIHGAPVSLIKSQARALGLPIDLIPLPTNPNNKDYEKALKQYFEKLEVRGIEGIVYGDVGLEDVRDYKQKLTEEHGLEAIFPLWETNTEDLATSMVLAGIKAVVCSVDPQKVDPLLLGHPFDAHFLNALKPEVDPCGENGEFHTFVLYTEDFRFPIDLMQLGKSQSGGMEMLEIFPYSRN